ncbi:MAG: hypothetical protein ACREO7_14600 [Pseudoxanthomonas sp.]
MGAGKRVGTAYQEALLALSNQVVAIFRQEIGDRYQVTASLIQDDTIICVSVAFLESDREAWVPLEIGTEGWNENRQQRIVHEASHVLEERLKLEKLTADYVNAKIRGVLDAYR